MWMAMAPKHEWEEAKVQSGEIQRAEPSCSCSDGQERSSVLREELQREGNYYTLS